VSSVQVSYVINLQEIKPWPPSQSSIHETPVILHWEMSAKHSGSTRRVTPQIGPDVGDGKMSFNESFLLPVILFRESSNKASNLKNNDKFQKKFLELNLYETKNERIFKGKLLGSAVVDLADYGILKSSISTSVPLSLKRGPRNVAQPSLFFSIRPYDRNSVSDGLDSEGAQAYMSPGSSRDPLSNRTSLDKDARDSLAAVLLSDEDAEEAEIASFTDDESSSHSLSPVSTSASETKVNLPYTKPEHTFGVQQVEDEHVPAAIDIYAKRFQRLSISSAEALPVKTAAVAAATAYASKRVLSYRDGLSSFASSADLSSDPGSPESQDSLMFTCYETRSPQIIVRSPVVPPVKSSSAPPSDNTVADYSVTNNREINKVLLEVNGEKNIAAGKDAKKEYQGIGKYRKEEPEVNLGHNTQENIDGKTEKETEEIDVNAIRKAFDGYANHELKEVNGENNLLEDAAPDNRQLQEKPSNLNSEKNEHEAKVLYSVIRNLKEEVRIQTPEPKSTLEEETTERSTGGIQAREVSGYKIARQAKVAIKEEHQWCPQSVRANMEKQIGGKQASKTSRDPTKKATKIGTEVRNGGKNGAGVRAKSLQDSKAKNLKVPVKSISDSAISPVTEVDEKFVEEVKEISISETPSTNVENGASDETNSNSEEGVSKEENMKIIFAEARAAVADEKVKQMELEIEKLEGELREAAAIEAAVYSVAAEHGGSSHKVHSPARRLARFYIHACKHWSQDRRAGAARNAASGLILAAKACGHDVPRLTFWWSNTVVLREIVSQTFESSQLSPQAFRSNGSNGVRKNQRLPSPQKMRDSLNKQGGGKLSHKQNLNDWEETHTLTTALQKVELWIYGRVIESVWWQTLTPHMQRLTEDAIKEQRGLYARKGFEKLLGPELGNRHQGKFSIDLWKKAFLDAFQRLCPIRAGGHECGCLPILAKMVMEQCVARLDVAMFNAILRQSEEEMPTDPISDPISDPSVLPIPAGNLSFGAGAQLKNAVGNWSRWLTDLVGIDAEDSPRVGGDSQEDNNEDVETTFSSFPLLNATSDLLMLPKDMLMEKSIRKEVCPVLSLPLIKRILSNFVADEFCPDPVPCSVMETLNAEIPLEQCLQGEEDSTYSSLLSAPSIQYSPPPAASVREKIGDVSSHIHLGRSASNVLRKGYTSDDELDELESPLLSLLDETMHGVAPQKIQLHSNGKSRGHTKQPTGNAGLNRRYQLLREAWIAK